MKELSIEEKAKAYDEAKNKLSRFIARGVDPLIITRADVQDLFPELKEGKDERIRKWLICTLKSLNNSPVQIDGAYEMMLPAIAWLEKQGEQSDANKEYWRGYNEGKQCVLGKYAEIEKLGEQKPADKSDVLMSLDEAIAHCKEKSCGDNACALEHKQLEKWLTELKELKERKPALSEEDERIIDGLISICDEAQDDIPRLSVRFSHVEA